MNTVQNSALVKCATALAQLTDQLGKPGFCDALYATLSTVVDADNFIVIAYKGTKRPHVLVRRCDNPVPFSEIDSKYLASHYLLDPFHTAHLRRVPRGLYRLQDIAPDKFRNTTYFLEYYRRTTLKDEVALLAYSRTEWTFTACLGRDGTSGRRFDRRQLAELNQLAPLLVALMEQHWASYTPNDTTADQSDCDVAQSLARSLSADKSIRLTPRQIEIGLLILQGHSSRSIGLILDISWQTVKVFRKQLYARCGISSQAELFALLLPHIGSLRSDVKTTELA